MPKLAKKTAAPKNAAPTKAPAKKTTKGAKQTPAPAATPTVAEEHDDAPGDMTKILYPEIELRKCLGDKAMTVAQAKELLGWEDEDEYAERLSTETAPSNDKKKGDKAKAPVVKFGDVYDLVDHFQHKVRLWRNTNNRRFDISLARLWESEILNGHWKANGENLIFGKTGRPISAQHRLVALVLAGQEVAKNPDKWPFWDGKEPTMECTLCLGVDEGDETINTIGTGRPQTLADVLYRSEYFKTLPPKDRDRVSKIAGSALQMLGARTHAFVDAFAPNKVTHADYLSMIDRHPRIIDAVKHCWEENGEKGNLAKHFIGAGYAAALCYLMGCSASDPANYFASDPPNEDMLDWDRFDLACTFWVDLAASNNRMTAVREKFAAMLSPEDGEEQASISVDERCGVLIKAWLLYAAKKPLTLEALALEYEQTEDGKKLVDYPLIGGIDKGKPRSEDDDAEESGESPDPTPEQLEQRKAQERAKQEATNGKAAPAPAKGSVTSADYGSLVWVRETPVDASWRGTLMEIFDDAKHAMGPRVAKVKVAKGFASTGKGFASTGKIEYVRFDQLQHAQPELAE